MRQGDVQLLMGRGWRLLAVMGALFLMLGAACASAADPSKTFDANLSLTGGCATSPVDPVPDPGCAVEPQRLPPSGSFRKPTAVATDFYGNIYVANFGGASSGTEGRIDVFSPDGLFITEVLHPGGPMAIAVDSKGTLYVVNQGRTEKIVRYDPTGPYNPEDEEIEYGDPPVVVEPEERSSIAVGIAVDVETDHLFANFGGAIVEYASAEGDNEKLGTIGAASSPGGLGLALDSSRNLLYKAQDANVVEIFELNSPHEEVGTIEGSAVPGGQFLGNLSLAVDEGTGHLFVLDGHANKVYEFSDTWEYLATIEHSFASSNRQQIGIDNGPFSPNGEANPIGRYLFVPSHPTGEGHSFAFEPLPPTCPPKVESVSVGDISETEAELKATINSCNLPTNYVFEYTTQQRYEEEGFAGATTAGSGQLAANNIGVPVIAGAQGLNPGTNYRFRVVASNAKVEAGGEVTGEGTFSTYASNSLPSCPNEAVRTGVSALLPDCRAFELVTPPSTNGRNPRGAGSLGGNFFTMPQVSPSGDKVPFTIEGGAIPGEGGTGGASALAGDPYMASRSPGGWTTDYIGPNGSEAVEVLPGATSPDQGFSFFEIGPSGSLALGPETKYVRYPDGHFALIGRGSLGVDRGATGVMISEGGGHIIFSTGLTVASPAVQLEPNAPPPYPKVVEGGVIMEGTRAIYDRTSDEVTHVVSLLPGDETPAGGEDATYRGASFDGRGVAFSIDDVLYLRYDNTETYEIGEDVTFAGVAEGGSRIFYVEGGTLWRFDAATGERLAFNASGTVVPVNISPDGSTAYFVSTSVLTKATNPNGTKAKLGQQNLYLSREGDVSFVALVTERDVVGEKSSESETARSDGLGLWTEGLAEVAGLGADPSRVTQDGAVLLFASRASLTSYDSGGKVEIYRYDYIAERLDCLSCNPTGAAPTGDASLQSSTGESGVQLLSSFARVTNLSADGRRAFFQSFDPLVAGDTDGRQDVYEWEANGVGSCSRAEGCLYLISSGHSARNDYLFAASPSGDDVFFLSSDKLLPRDAEETPSIYDARVGGGFPEPQEAECEGEGCRPGMTAPPPLQTGRTSPLGQEQKPKRRCPKGKRKVKRHGKVRCVKKHRKHHRQHKAGTKKGGSK
jgi:hypothetical protein